MSELTQAQDLKFHLLASGMQISDRAADHLGDLNDGRPLTPADYASTSGLILRLDDDVWVNAPTARYNPNFVGASPFVLDLIDDTFVISGEGLTSRARVWIPPAYHGRETASGRPFNHMVFSHGDRARLAPIGGCSMTCKFCNIPYEDRYWAKPLDLMIESVEAALNDPIQPAHHLLISGGTPHDRDIPYLRETYVQILDRFATIPIDIMMAPVGDLLDYENLSRHGLNEMSINIEIFNREIAATVMRQKYQQGLQHYLDEISRASQILGPSRVRSMLMVGLEPIEDTVAGARAIVEHGGTPVLSPFRPDPATPLSNMPPPDAETLRETYLRCLEVTDGQLGPDCPPCTHNTLTFVEPGVTYERPEPYLVGG